MSVAKNVFCFVSGIQKCEVEMVVFEIKEQRGMSGITWYDNKIYVLCEKQRVIRVFRDVELFEELEEEKFILNGMGDQLDMVACEVDQSIIISDWEKSCLWITCLLNKKQTCMTLNGQPGRLWRSLFDEKLLMVVERKNNGHVRFHIDIYESFHKSVIGSVLTPSEVNNVWNAVETSHKTFVISHEKVNENENESSPGKWMISELSADGGKFLRTFDPYENRNAAHLVNWSPFNVLISAQDIIYVAEQEGKKNNNIIYRLQFAENRIVLSETTPLTVAHSIKRMAYMRNNNQMIVGQCAPLSLTVQVFQLSTANQ